MKLPVAIAVGIPRADEAGYRVARSRLLKTEPDQQPRRTVPGIQFISEDQHVLAQLVRKFVSVGEDPLPIKLVQRGIGGLSTLGQFIAVDAVLVVVEEVNQFVDAVADLELDDFGIRSHGAILGLWEYTLIYNCY